MRRAVLPGLSSQEGALHSARPPPVGEEGGLFFLVLRVGPLPLCSGVASALPPTSLPRRRRHVSHDGDGGAGSGSGRASQGHPATGFGAAQGKRERQRGAGGARGSTKSAAHTPRLICPLLFIAGRGHTRQLTAKATSRGGGGRVMGYWMCSAFPQRGP